MEKTEYFLAVEQSWPVCYLRSFIKVGLKFRQQQNLFILVSLIVHVNCSWLNRVIDQNALTCFC
jgi:hypothetical protein